MRIRSLIAASLTLVLTVLPARAADHTIFTLQWAGLDAMTAASPKDAFLRAAFAAVGPRLAQLPAEINQDPADGAIAAAFWEPIRGATLFRLAINDDDPANLRVRMALEITPVDPARAVDIARAAARAAEKEGVDIIDDGPVRRFTNRKGDEVVFGVRSGTFVMRINGLENAAPSGTLEAAPADAPLLMRMHFSGPALSRAIDLAPDADTPDSIQGRAALGALGLYGENAITIDAGMWHGAGTIDGAAIVRGARASWAPGPDAVTTIGAEFLAKIPADVTACTAGAFDIGALIDRVVRAINPDDPDAIYAQAEQSLGFNPKTDLLDHIGPRFAWYQSEQSGGAGFMSMVGLAQIRDPQAFARTHAMLVDRITNFGLGLARGYVAIQRSEVGGRSAFVLRTPGLPLPIAITWAIEGDTVIKGLSPAAFIAGSRFANTGGASIATHTDLKARIGDVTNVASFGFTDTARKAKQSVGAATAMLIMAANATRMNIAGAVPMPDAAALTDGVKPVISWSTWAGDDLVSRWTMDNSLTVLGGIVLAKYTKAGSIQAAPMLFGLLTPAIVSARMDAKAAVSQHQLKQIAIAMMNWSGANNDRVVPSLDALVEGGYLQPELLQSPFGSVDGSKWGYALRQGFSLNTQIDRPATTIALIDIVAYYGYVDRIPVAYFDGRAELLSRSQANHDLAQPHNQPLERSLRENKPSD